MRDVLREVSAAARLWRIWVRLGVQDVRLRFRRSVLGVGWIFVNLAVMILAVGLIYGRLLGQDLRAFLPFLAIGLIAWGFVAASIAEGGGAFVTSEGYIKQIALPIYVYVLRVFVRASVTSLVSFLAYVVVAVVYSVPVGAGVLWVLVGVVQLGLVALLLMTIFAYLNVRFRDATHIATVGLQVAFYATPVLWPPELLRGRGIEWVIDFNPLYHLLEVIRQPLLVSRPAAPVNYLAVGCLIAGLAALAAACMRRYQRQVVYLL